MIQTLAHLLKVELLGDDEAGPDEESDTEAIAPAESIEENTELKLHVMGSKMLFAQSPA